MLRLATKSDISYTDARNMYYEKTGNVVSYSQIAYTAGLNISTLFGTNEGATDASDTVLRYLDNSNHKYVSLCQDAVTAHAENCSLYMLHKNRNDVKSLKFSCTHEAISKYANKYRKAYKVKADQHAWMTDHEMAQFDKSPEVILVDGTEKYILMTVTVKDRYGKMCIVLRSYIPNEKKWTFCWLFSDVFPLLLPRLLLSRINIVISDGDSSECNKIDNMLKMLCITQKEYGVDGIL